MDYLSGAPNGLSGLAIDTQDVTPFATPQNAFTSGKLTALFEARDITTVAFQKKIDALAEDLITRFDAAEGGGNRGVFDLSAGAASDPGAAGALIVNTLVAADPALFRDGVSGGGAPGGVGDNAYVRGMIEQLSAANTPSSGAGVAGAHSASMLVSEIVSVLGGQSHDADRSAALRASQYEFAFSMEKAAINVDVDHELKELTLVQNAYAANARIIQVIDEMFNELMGALR